MSPPLSSQKASQLKRNANQEITDASLKSPTMLKTTMDKAGRGGSKLRNNQSPSNNDATSMAGTALGERTNPFRFIE